MKSGLYNPSVESAVFSSLKEIHFPVHILVELEYTLYNVHKSPFVFTESLLPSSKDFTLISQKNYKCTNILEANQLGNMPNLHTITLRILWQPRWCSNSDTITYPVTKFDAFALLCYAAYLGRLFPTIRDSLSVLSSRIEQSLLYPWRWDQQAVRERSSVMLVCWNVPT